MQHPAPTRALLALVCRRFTRHRHSLARQTDTHFPLPLQVNELNLISLSSTTPPTALAFSPTPRPLLPLLLRGLARFVLFSSGAILQNSSPPTPTHTLSLLRALSAPSPLAQAASEHKNVRLKERSDPLRSPRALRQRSLPVWYVWRKARERIERKDRYRERHSAGVGRFVFLRMFVMAGRKRGQSHNVLHLRRLLLQELLPRKVLGWHVHIVGLQRFAFFLFLSPPSVSQSSMVAHHSSSPLRLLQSVAPESTRTRAISIGPARVSG